jgi:hypothetical protein
MKYPGTKTTIRENFYSIDEKNLHGIIRNNENRKLMERILEDPRAKSSLRSWKFWNLNILNLNSSEKEEAFPERVENSFLIGKCYSQYFPEVLGLIYSGKGSDRLTGNFTGHIITPFVEGESLISCIDSMEQKELDVLGVRIRDALDILRRKNLFLLSFAPRNIINGRYGPIFVDSGNLRVSVRDSQKGALKRLQKDKFYEDYFHLLEKDKFLKLEETISRK